MVGMRQQWTLQRLGPDHEHSTLNLDSDVIVIGRSKEATYKLKSVYLSRSHATLKFRGDHWTLRDHGSVNGTFVIDRRLTPENDYPLNIGDTIGFGMPTTEPIIEGSVIYRLCREETSGALEALSVGSTGKSSPQQSLQATKKEMLDLDETLAVGSGLNGESNAIPAFSSAPDDVILANGQRMPECIINVPRCDSREFMVPRGVSWQNVEEDAPPVKLEDDDEISAADSKRKIKVTPQRVVIDLCDSDDDLEDEGSSALNGGDRSNNVVATGSLHSPPGMLPPVSVSELASHLPNHDEPPNAALNQEEGNTDRPDIKTMSLIECVDHSKRGNAVVVPDNDFDDSSCSWKWPSLLKVKEVPACTREVLTVTEEMPVETSEAAMSPTKDDIEDAFHVPSVEFDVEMNNNSGYSQEDEVILISDDETYFSQKSIKAERTTEVEVEVMHSEATYDENDDWDAIFKMKSGADLELECSQDDMDLPSPLDPKSLCKGLEALDLAQPGPSGYKPPHTDHSASIACTSKDDHPLEPSDYFPVLSQTFDTDSEESDNSAHPLEKENGSLSVEWKKKGEPKKVRDHEPQAGPSLAPQVSNSFYRQRNNTVYDRLKRKPGDQVPSSIKATRLTNAQPLVVGRRKSLVQVAQAPAKTAVAMKVAPRSSVVPSHVAAVDKTKNKSSLRVQIQHKMGHRIPHPGGGSAVPAGSKSPTKASQRRGVVKDDTGRPKNDKNLRLDKLSTFKGNGRCSSEVIASAGARGPVAGLPGTSNASALNFSNMSRDAAVSLDVGQVADGLSKGKPTKVPQRLIPSRSEIFAAELRASSSKPVAKRKATLQESSHPAKKANIDSGSKGVGERANRRNDAAQPRRMIYLDDIIGARQDTPRASGPVAPQGRGPAVPRGSGPPQQLPDKLPKPSATDKKSNRCVRFSDQVTTYIIDRVMVEDQAPLQSPQDEENVGFAQYRPEVIAAVNRNLDICLSWKSAWLPEQQNFKYPPPIVNGIVVKRTAKSYSSHREYVEVFEPLLLHEMWDSISSDWHQRRSSLPNFQLVLNKVCDDRQPSLRPQILLFHCHVLVAGDEERFGQVPQEGWLTILEVPNSVTDGTGRSCVLRLFAYIESCHKMCLSYLQRDGRLSPLLREMVSKSKSKVKSVLKLVLRTRYRNVEVSLDRPLNVEMISYIRPQLRLFQALHTVPHFPLGMPILKPQRELCTLPPFPLNRKLVHVGRLMYNSMQRRAILRVAEAVMVDKSPKICLVQGPPGTGKTSLVVGLIIQLLFGSHIDEGMRKPQILLCAPSNGAVDEDLHRLVELREALREKGGLRIIRVGQIEGIQARVRPYSLENIIRNNVESRSGPDAIQKEITSLTTNLNRKQQEHDTLLLHRKNAEASKIAADMRRLRHLLEESNKQLDDWRNMTPEDYQRKCNVWREEVLTKADVIATTLGSCTQHGMEVFFRKQQHPFICIIDEATQSVEPEVLLPLQFGVNKLILVGDPQQLPATVTSLVAREKHLNLSLFERLEINFRGRGSHPAVMLEMQYRMHPELCAYPSKAFYESKLRTDSELISKCVSVPFVPYVVFDVGDSAEQSTGNGDISNMKEAVFVTKLCEALLLKCRTFSIGVITFYQHQKRLLNEQFRLSNIICQKDSNDQIEINTVDGFQGREKDVIVVSTVRANSPNGGIGFINHQRRLNVAITRGRFSLYICGHLASLKVSECWRGLIQDAQLRKKIEKVSSLISVAVLQDLVLKS